jgi:hypothetical protein
MILTQCIHSLVREILPQITQPFIFQTSSKILIARIGIKTFCEGFFPIYRSMKCDAEKTRVNGAQLLILKMQWYIRIYIASSPINLSPHSEQTTRRYN